MEVLALIDTGASCTVVKPEIIERLGLKPIDVVPIYTASSPIVNCNIYTAVLMFPTHIDEVQAVITSTEIAELPLEGQSIQCLVGRDVLKHGLFIYNGDDQSITLSF